MKRGRCCRLRCEVESVHSNHVLDDCLLDDLDHCRIEADHMKKTDSLVRCMHRRGWKEVEGHVRVRYALEEALDQ